MTKPWDAPQLAARARPGQRRRRPVRAGELPDALPRAATRGSPSGCRERTWIYRTRVAGRGDARASTGVDYARDASSSTASRSRARRLDVTGRSTSSSDGSTCSRSRARRRRASEPQVGRTSRVRVHKPRHELRLGLLPAARAPGDLAAGPEPRLPPCARDGVGRVSRRRGRARVERRSSGGRTARRAAALRRGDFEVGFRRSSSTATRSSSTASDPRAGTGARSTRSTASRGRRSSSGCCGSPRDAHVNLLRVWGGGLIETDEFYDAVRPARDRSSGRSSRSRRSGHRERAVATTRSSCEQLLADARRRSCRAARATRR